ncbi:MAG: aromatic-ring-hydroxylating dioxygenase subunit beta [Pseudomonadota bacterium]
MTQSKEHIRAFIAHETWLLNTQAWDEWTALFSPAGAYWMPLTPAQDSPKNHVSLMYEAAALRAARIARLKKSDGLSVETMPRSVRHVSSLIIDSISENEWHARAAVMMAEYARGEVNTFHGTVQWHLQASGSGLVIELKRVDLINAEGALSDILTYI